MSQEFSNDGLTSARPEKYIRMLRLNLGLAIVLVAVGSWLIKRGLEPHSSLQLELLRELGGAIVTAGIVEIVLFGLIDRFKTSLAAPFIEAEVREEQRNKEFSRVMDGLGKAVEKIGEETFRTTVKTDLDLIKLTLEQILYAVDPIHRQIVDAVKKESPEQTG